MSWFRTGTVSVTNGSTSVTGSGTTWIASAAVGEALLAPDGKLYEIASISSDTSMTLGSVYLGSTQSAQAYVIVPSQSYIRDLASQASSLVNNYSTFYNTIGQGRFTDGTVSAPSVTFSADTNTGFFRSGADEVTLVANGVAQAKWGATGFTIMNAASVNIDGGSIDSTPIGAVTPSTGAFTTLSATGNTTLGDASTDTVTVNGYMGVGGTGVANASLNLASTALTGTVQIGLNSAPVATSSATSSVIAIGGSVKTAAAAFTVTDGISLYTGTPIKGAGSTITNLHGVFVTDQTQGTNNYGITSLVSSGTNKWNIYASGTAANYFAGNVGVGDSTLSRKLTVNHATGDWASFKLNGVETLSLVDTGLLIKFSTPNVSTDRAYQFETVGSQAALTIGVNGALALLGASTSATGVGISFPATQVASSDANTLDDYREATYTATATGMTTSPTGTVSFVRVGNKVTMEIPAITGTSNATTFTLTGGPTTMRPSANRNVIMAAQDNSGAWVPCQVTIGTDGIVYIYKDVAGSAFTSSGTKSFAKNSCSYII